MPLTTVDEVRISSLLFYFGARLIPPIDEQAFLAGHLRQVCQRHGPVGDGPVVNPLRPLFDLFRGVKHHAVGRHGRGGMVGFG